ncbi:MAG: hypothetical protein HY952_01680 [Elusimicrobia bacterium]|nr:hypothetical protein [Elusimicrobiota bacterium]
MKYWFYSEGNILGPYEPAEMLALPAFAEESLVCPETCTGDNPGDWRPASQIPDVAAAMSVGVGRVVGAGVMSGAYDYETGFSSTVRYFEDKEPGPGASYGDLLDTIDNILGAYKEGKESPARPGQDTDYDLAEKFDIRLSRIQEELEAARWEKNLLLEKIRMKDLEEKKNRERILELEARVKNELGRSAENVRELEQVRHLAELKEKDDTIRKIEEIRKEELALKDDSVPAARPAPKAAAQPGPAAQAPAPRPEGTVPEMESRVLKSIPQASRIKLETSLGVQPKEPSDDAGLTSRKFKSLGQTQAPAYVYGSHYDKPLPGPEAAPPGAFKPENLEPLPQQAGGVVYDFTVVTAKGPETSQQFKIAPKADAPGAPAVPPAAQSTRTMPSQAQAVKPPTFDFGVPQKAAAPQPQAAPQHGFTFGVQPAAAAAPAAQPSQPAPAVQPAEDKKAPAAPADSPETTQRIPVATVKGAPAPKPQEKPKKKGGKMAFLGILVAFASVAAGGLGYLFLGEGASTSELLMMNIGGRKKPAALTSQLEDKGPAAKAEPAGAPAAEAQPQPEGAQQAQQPPAAPEPAKPVSENIRKALDIVKNYKLSGGRGTIATWFANSFLSGAAGGANEEWTATPLHGDILVVQYRLLRPKQDPLIYQFEVDSAKQDIVRGINNNAIELLDQGVKEKSAAAVPAKKPAAKPKARKSSRPKEVPLLPLPDAPAAGQSPEADPTGFENGQGEGSEQVKYLKAQESDEELF